MSEFSDWNRRVIEEFRANGGKVGGQFEGAPLLLAHHVGRRTGREYVDPMMYLPEGERMYVFASKGGAPTHPDWYHNLVDAGEATVEVGTERVQVKVTEVTGAERDRIYAEQARRYLGFANYAKQTEGVRVIPVLALDPIR